MTFHGGYLSVDDVLSNCSDRREDCINPHKNPSQTFYIYVLLQFFQPIVKFKPNIY